MHPTTTDKIDVWGRLASERWPLLVMAALFVLIGADVLEDALSGAPWAHLTLEASIEVVLVFGIVRLWRVLGAARREAADLARNLESARQEATRWSEEARVLLRGLGEAIDRQFERWGLTAAERDIGLLLLKGLSHREIASIRKTNEQTVRQQALSLYRKSGLGGRTDLAAFFLEDLLLPASEGGSGSRPGAGTGST